MNTENTNKQREGDNIGAIAEALFIIGLLFVGIGYVALLGLYFLKNSHASTVSKNHLKQTLIAATFSLFIAAAFIIYIMSTTGFNSATALILIEVYLMVIIPIFMFFGIMGFVQAINYKDYQFPLIGKLMGIRT